MTVRDDDLRRYSADACAAWLGSLGDPPEEHRFSRRFRFKIYLSRFHAYRLYYTSPLKKILRGVGIFLLICLLVLALMPLEQGASDISFVRGSDSLVIRIDDRFEMEESIIDSLLMPHVAPMTESSRSVEVEDMSVLFGQDGPTLVTIGDTHELLGRIRLSVIAEMDFYGEGQYRGTIEVITPRDQASIKDGEPMDEWKVFVRCGERYIAFRKGNRYFAFYPRDAAAENLTHILFPDR